MDEKNQQALALAFKRVRAKKIKIAELGILPDWNQETVDKTIVALSEAKAKEDGSKWETHVKGQRWYVEDLVKFSGYDKQQAIDTEYAAAFPEVADESELMDELDKYFK